MYVVYEVYTLYVERFGTEGQGCTELNHRTMYGVHCTRLLTRDVLTSITTAPMGYDG